MGKRKVTSVKKIKKVKVKRKYTRKNKLKSELKGGNDSVFEFTKLNNEDKEKVYSFRRWVNTFVTKHIDNSDFVNEFKKEFESYSKYINTLIPVNNSFYPVDKKTNTIVNSVPLLVILYKHLNDRIQLTELFLKESGNINLISTRFEYNAISIAIELSDLELIDFLLENGSIATLEQKDQITTMRQEKIPSLNLNDESTSISKWKDIIPNLESIRTKLHELIDNEYKVCDIIQTIIPSNYTPTEIYIPDKPYVSNGTTIYPLPPTDEMKKNLTDDFHNYNRILCATILIYGIIGQILNPYIQIVTKGGRATQLLVTDTYKTEDVDILILSDNTEVNTENVSANICYLVKWFLESKFETAMKKTTGEYPVYKVSYVKHVKLGGIKSFNSFTDIDFTIPPKKEFYNNMVTYPFSTDFGQLLFTVPNIGSMLNEKLFYYNKYFLEKNEYMTNKLLKSIKSLNKTLAQKKNIDETELLQRRIDTLSKQNTITASDMLSKTI